jgi:hypothetical protein
VARNKGGLGVYHERRRAEARRPVLLASDALRERLLVDAEQSKEVLVSYIEWARRIPEPKTGTLDFRRWPFQRELYTEGADEHEIVVQKGTQVGVSTYLIRWAMFWPDIKGLTALYIFPKKVQLYDFSQGRVKPLTKTEYLIERMGRDDVDNAMMKRIGLGLIYFRGSEVKDDLDSVDADVIAFDEYDRLDQHNIEDAEHRVDASPLGLIRRVGNPTVDDFGIAGFYSRSDRRQWLVKCGACNEWQALDFWRNVDQDVPAVVCAACRKSLDVREGEWVAQHPSKDVRGYHINRLMVHGVNLSKIIANSTKHDPYAKATFFNKDLGLPYVGSEDRLSEAHLGAAQTIRGRYQMPFDRQNDRVKTMGVDVASKRDLNVIVSEWDSDFSFKTVLWTGLVRRWYIHEPGDGPSLEELMQRYQINCAAFDHEPEYLTVRGFAQAFPGRAVIVNYATQKELLTVDTAMQRASVRRTEQIDRSFTRIRRQKVALPGDVPVRGAVHQQPGFVEQMRSLVRVVEENEKGQRVARYVLVGTTADYAHAMVYDDVAADYFRIAAEVSELVNDEGTPLDEMLQFERSAVNDPDDTTYHAGPDESGWEDLL